MGLSEADVLTYAAHCALTSVICLSPPLLTLLPYPLGVIISLRHFCALGVLWYYLWGPQRPPCDDHCTCGQHYLYQAPIFFHVWFF